MNRIKNIFKYIYNINYSFYIFILNLLIIISVILIILFVYKSDTIMFKAVDIFDERTQNVLNVKEKRDSFMKFVENINFFSTKLFKPITYSDYQNLPVFDLKLTRKNIEYINDVISRSLDQSKNIYSLGPFISIYDNDFIDDTRSKLFYNNELYSAFSCSDWGYRTDYFAELGLNNITIHVNDEFFREYDFTDPGTKTKILMHSIWTDAPQQ